MVLDVRNDVQHRLARLARHLEGLKSTIGLAPPDGNREHHSMIRSARSMVTGESSTPIARAVLRFTMSWKRETVRRIGVVNQDRETPRPRQSLA
jgi:hypothetical protein